MEYYVTLNKHQAHCIMSYNHAREAPMQMMTKLEKESKLGIFLAYPLDIKPYESAQL